MSASDTKKIRDFLRFASELQRFPSLVKRRNWLDRGKLGRDIGDARKIDPSRGEAAMASNEALDVRHELTLQPLQQMAEKAARAPAPGPDGAPGWLPSQGKFGSGGYRPVLEPRRPARFRPFTFVRSWPRAGRWISTAKPSLRALVHSGKRTSWNKITWPASCAAVPAPGWLITTLARVVQSNRNG